LKEEVALYIKKSEHALEVAEQLIKDGYPSDAASKIYYSMFYAAQALLKSEGVDVIKHSAAESAFGYHFAKQNRIDPKFHKMLINARKMRELADYDVLEEITEPTAIAMMNDCKEFLSTIKTTLQRSNR